MRIFILRGRTLRASGLAIVEIIPEPGVPADPVLVIQADVEPNRRIEGAMLIHAKPGQFVVKCLRGLRVREVTIGNSPIGNRPGDPMDQLPHRGFAAAFVRIGAVGDVAVEIFRDRDLGGERAPAFRHLDILLLEDHLAAVVGDLSGALFPLDLIERLHLRIAENALKPQRGALPLREPGLTAPSRRLRFAERGRVEAGFQLDHFW